MKKLMTLLSVLFSATTFAQNIGIGETAPTAMKLQVKAADSAVALIQNSTALGSNIKTGLFFKTGNFYSGSIATVGSGATFRMGLFTYGGSNPSDLVERISILDGGNVGIGTTNPSAKLEVAGSFKITDGSQGMNKVLTSDGFGNATWTTPSGITLPYSATINNGSTLLSLANSLGGCISGYSPGHTGISGVTSNGQGVAGSANSGVALYGYSNTGIAASLESPSGIALKTIGDVEINGSVKIVDGTQAANNVLTTDGAGNATWKPNANATVFSVTKSNNNNQTILSSAGTLVKINFNTGVLNQSGNAYNYSNSEFTAPANGFYHFDVTLSIANSNTNSSLSDIFISLYKRDPSFPAGYMFYNHQLTNTNGAVSSGNSHSLSTTIYLTQNDIIDVRVLNQSATSITILGQGAINFYSYFSGYRVF
jgi:hypothetical protein